MIHQKTAISLGLKVKHRLSENLFFKQSIDFNSNLIAKRTSFCVGAFYLQFSIKKELHVRQIK